MRNSIKCYLLFLVFHEVAFADPISNAFDKQTEAFPQEKIYVQTDKPAYVSGEDIWFRAYVTDYWAMLPDTTSRYVYGELIDTHNNLIRRVKIKSENGAYYGHIDIPQGSPSGSYYIRFYTRYTENVGEDYFYRKRIAVENPFSGMFRIEPSFNAAGDDGKINVELRFVTVADNLQFRPRLVRVKNNKGELTPYELLDNNAVRLLIDEKSDVVNNSLYVEFDHRSITYGQYIPVPSLDKDYDVAFFPEGGYLPSDVPCRLAFKALKSNGYGEKITAVVIGQEGDTVGCLESNYLGMGMFPFKAYTGEVYTAVCRNADGVEKKFTLPSAKENTIALNTTWDGERLKIALRRTLGMTLPKSMRLIIRCRAEILYNKPWDTNLDYIWFEKNKIPSGVVHVILINSDSEPLSERLVFNIDKRDFATTLLMTDEADYGKRDKISSSIIVTDGVGRPLSGSFSVSVTDDKYITPDTMNTILTTLLLTSELKGYIEDPGYYFANDSIAKVGLDALLMSQGWRRYDVPQLLKGKIQKPKIDIEVAPRISGEVRNSLSKNVGGAVITMISQDSIPFMSVTSTNRRGRFVFKNCERPDSTVFIVQATKKDGNKGTLELTMDETDYPNINRYMLPLFQKKSPLHSYLSENRKQYFDTDEMQSILIDDIVVSARKSEPQSIYSSKINDNNTIKAKDYPNINNQPLLFLANLPGVYLRGNVGIEQGLFMVGGGASPGKPYLMINNILYDPVHGLPLIATMPVDAIEMAEVIRGPQMAMFGVLSEEVPGIINIITKADFQYKKEDPLNIKHILPLGYQMPKEFYQPKYEIAEIKDGNTPDMRTTIYWNPNVIVGADGRVDLNFYSADAPSSYSAVIEGLTADGRFIRTMQEYKIR